MLKTLDFTINTGSTATFIYFDLYHSTLYYFDVNFVSMLSSALPPISEDSLGCFDLRQLFVWGEGGVTNRIYLRTPSSSVTPLLATRVSFTLFSSLATSHVLGSDIQARKTIRYFYHHKLYQF